jgi:hypothetical protein
MKDPRVDVNARNSVALDKACHLGYKKMVEMLVADDRVIIPHNDQDIAQFSNTTIKNLVWKIKAKRAQAKRAATVVAGDLMIIES